MSAKIISASLSTVCPLVFVSSEREREREEEEVLIVVQIVGQMNRWRFWRRIEGEGRGGCAGVSFSMSQVTLAHFSVSALSWR